MVKAEWGTKRTCQSCGARFYDMNRTPIICPKCEAEFKIEAPKPRRTAAAPKPAPAEKPKAEPPEEEALDDEDALEADDDGDDLLEAEEDMDDEDDVPIVPKREGEEDT